MENVRFHDSKLKLLKALLFRSFHETEAPTAGFCSVFICGRAYWLIDRYIGCFQTNKVQTKPAHTKERNMRWQWSSSNRLYLKLPGCTVCLKEG